MRVRVNKAEFVDRAEFLGLYPRNFAEEIYDNIRKMEIILIDENKLRERIECIKELTEWNINEHLVKDALLEILEEEDDIEAY